MPSHILQRRENESTAARIALSAATTRGAHLRTEDFGDWLAERRRTHTFRVERIPFAELDGWSFQASTGNLVHRSGRFFTVEGLHVTEDGEPYGDGPRADWYQPIIKQPEVGVLGILVKEFDGVLHFLMQAKMEPGNPNLLQLSPTVQATRSNYTKAHRGADVKYIEYFVGPGRGRIVADVLQSEHGSWFYRKSNRNMVVEAVGEVPLLDDFCWLTLGQINELLHRDHVINMDSRTVLSCLPFGDASHGALLSDTELLSWVTGERTRHSVRAERVPLDSVPGWKRGESAIEHEEGRYFRVVAVSVQAGNREVTGWTQPLFEPVGPGVTAFLTRDFDGVPHVLVHARVEGGFLDTVELGPTVQYTPENYAHLPAEERPLFLDTVLRAGPDRIRYAAVHSEEGGRFLNADSRCLVVEADAADAPLQAPPGYAWVTPAQLTSLVRHGHYLNVQARTMLACLNAAAVGNR
ncbi:NDP-hexose 2,3-dehydratase family protein [Streptomyces chromofuscus]|uniref:NDP-hexose 2,3-dehydratase family protein n=1 Tax=Streptomyces chromofuscus TaxID=42881 RepID=A0A7M2T8K2_STRCW|nr:NDP-hexose 2,3-dehydratase family protein [Streptomyces chromofuscus]QOV43741.1 NDP-hexose 2,3-dehydratase family protein [Streptomyces chromofuscus]GGT35519.1 NDP-hexose 2,3-dehydratase [Streptomyces chromofuscus]